MTDKTDKKKDVLNKTQPPNHQSQDDTMISKVESSGIDYINKQKHYLTISGLIPIIIIIVQILNIYFIFNAPQPAQPTQPIPPQLNQPRPNPTETIIPAIVLIIFAISALFKFKYQYLWKKKVNQYQKFQNSSPMAKSNNIDYGIKGQHSMTKLFYTITDQMEKTKYLFYVLNIIFILSLQWVIGFFFIRFNVETLPGAPIHVEIMIWFNILTHILLIGYLIFEWKHFLRWNKKLVKLNLLEKKIYEELNIEEINNKGIND